MMTPNKAPALGLKNQELIKTELKFFETVFLLQDSLLGIGIGIGTAIAIETKYYHYLSAKKRMLTQFLRHIDRL